MAEEGKVVNEKKNEFENLGEDFPEQTVAAVPGESSDMIAGSNAGVEYDWGNAPDSVRAPERVDLDGKTVTITKAEIILPSKSTPWERTRDKSKEVKFCIFKLHYDIEAQQEFYSGVRVFRNNPDNELYSHPTMTRDGLSQASGVLMAYANYKKKDIKEISLREFMGFLNSKPKALIKGKEFKNPTTGGVVKKNMVDKFVD